MEEPMEDETVDKDWEWWIRIVRIENGYLVEHESEFGGKMKHAIVEPEYHRQKLDPGKQALAELAGYLWEFFGYYSGKYEEENLRVAIEKGHGREDYDGKLVSLWDYNCEKKESMSLKEGFEEHHGHSPDEGWVRDCPVCNPLIREALEDMKDE